MRLIKEGGRGHFDGLRGLYSTLSVGSRLACAIGARGLFKMPPIAAQNKADSNPKGAALASSQSLSECSTRVSTLRVLMRARVGDCRPARAERSPTSCRPLIDASSSQATLGASPATKPRADALGCVAWRRWQSQPSADQRGRRHLPDEHHTARRQRDHGLDRSGGLGRRRRP
jgi:hypothetical protein